MRFSRLSRCSLREWWCSMDIFLVSLACLSTALWAMSHAVGLKQLSHFIGGCLRRSGLKYCLGPSSLKFIFSSLWSDASITWGLESPFNISGTPYYVLLASFLSAHLLVSFLFLAFHSSISPTLALFHHPVSASLSVSSCSTCDELCSSCISRKAKIAS